MPMFIMEKIASKTVIVYTQYTDDIPGLGLFSSLVRSIFDWTNNELMLSVLNFFCFSSKAVESISFF